MSSDPNQDQSDPIVAIVQNLPDMASQSQPTGTIEANDGTRVTLGEQGHRTTAINNAQSNTNQRKG